MYKRQGPVLLEFPLLNKGSAFSMEERRNFNLLGLLPEVVETIEEQAERAWIQYQGFKTEIDKHIYLRNIQDTNETLFYLSLIHICQCGRVSVTARYLSVSE